MSSTRRYNRKVEDKDIIRLNSVGLSLSTIGELLNCHPTTIVSRLKALGISAADTRRSFMEDVYGSLTFDQQDWLSEQLGPHFSIKDFIKNLLVKEYCNQSRPSKAA